LRPGDFDPSSASSPAPHQSRQAYNPHP
jgi:hypothetical protein